MEQLRSQCCNKAVFQDKDKYICEACRLHCFVIELEYRDDSRQPYDPMSNHYDQYGGPICINPKIYTLECFSLGIEINV